LCGQLVATTKKKQKKEEERFFHGAGIFKILKETDVHKQWP
jgi:hypothetical protein